MGPTAAMPWPLVSKPNAAARAAGAEDVENAIAADAASATVKITCRINSGSSNISRSNSSISRGTSESSQRISSGTSNISDRSRNSSTGGIRRDVSHSSPHRIQKDEVHHAFVSGVAGIFLLPFQVSPWIIFCALLFSYIHYLYSGHV